MALPKRPKFETEDSLKHYIAELEVLPASPEFHAALLTSKLDLQLLVDLQEDNSLLGDRMRGDEPDSFMFRRPKANPR